MSDNSSKLYSANSSRDKRMKVGLLVYNPVSDSFGYSIRPKELCRNLNKIGCEARIFSPVDKSTASADGFIVEGVSKLALSFTKTISRSGRRLFKSSSIAKFLYRRRVLDSLSNRLVSSVFDKIRASDIDVLQGETQIASMAALKIGKRLGVPVVVDIHGLLIEEAIQYGFLKEASEQYHELFLFVSEILQQSDAVVVVSETLGSYIQEKFSLEKSKIFLVPNAGSVTDTIRPLRDTPNSLVYAGILEPWERVDLSIKSMPYVLPIHNSAKFSIAGHGSLKKELERLVKGLNLIKSTTFVGTIPHNTISSFLAQGDVALLPSTQDIVRKVACPIKLFDYLITGLPVVTVEGLWWSELVQKNYVGLATAGDPKSFAYAIEELLSDPTKLNKMSQNAVRLVKDKYNWLEMSKKLYTVYNNCVG